MKEEIEVIYFNLKDLWPKGYSFPTSRMGSGMVLGPNYEYIWTHTNTYIYTASQK